MHLTYGAIDQFSECPTAGLVGSSIDLEVGQGWRRVQENFPQLYSAWMFAWERHGDYLLKI